MSIKIKDTEVTMGIGVKISQFENSLEQNVKTFNEIFTDCNLPHFYNSDSEVEIGEIAGPDRTREVFVGGKRIIHVFKDEPLFLLDLPTRGAEPVINKKRGGAAMTVATSTELENLVIDEKEFTLEPIEYLLLQYLRGSQSQYHRIIDISEKLRKSNKHVRYWLRQLQEKEVIFMERVVEHHKMYIKVSEDWA